MDQMCRGAFERQSRQPDVDDDYRVGVYTCHEGPTIDDVNGIEILLGDAGKSPGVSLPEGLAFSVVSVCLATIDRSQCSLCTART